MIWTTGGGRIDTGRNITNTFHTAHNQTEKSHTQTSIKTQPSDLVSMRSQQECVVVERVTVQTKRLKICTGQKHLRGFTAWKKEEG